MIWLYERNGITARVETSYDSDTGEYVLRFLDSILGDTVERFNDQGAYQQRLLALEVELRVGEWSLAGPPTIVPEGFPRNRPKK
jgi:hypothetical protein